MRLFILFSSAVLFLMLASCAGVQKEQNTVFVEAGTTARVASDKLQPVTVHDTTGKEHIENRNIGGMIVMPKTVYDELRRGYLDNSTKPDLNVVIQPTPKTVRLSPVELIPTPTPTAPTPPAK